MKFGAFYFCHRFSIENIATQNQIGKLTQNQIGLPWDCHSVIDMKHVASLAVAMGVAVEVSRDILRTFSN